MLSRCMNQHGIIFDCDGTLMDSLGRAMESFNHALDRVGAWPRTPEQIKAHFGSSADRIFSRLLGDESLGARAFAFYLEHQTELAESTKVHQGVLELLDVLTENKVPIAIVTGRHHEDLEIVLKPHALSGRFLTMVADSHLTQSKPNPEGILLACRRMGVAPKNALYVGDSIVDIQAAHAAGGTAVAALWDNLVKPEDMRAQNPKYLAEKPWDVWKHYLDFAGKAPA